ncbi:3-deoxy-7-phosphoheptulonate synthase [Microbispora sp. RL4-1S]|uniref:3-deoxy-7-phosphoheptulonate synthase n=1 Tax=Microbispora oryzae TaxID=2806554 RepID=A0A941AP13_9ACTN|nr:3-deoxy-7-phosphoheptulonate synthase [Microbispora oryzae]MBP2703229.1 3-deoxy-7-phosphoheptulonate synthase [Microbispora oryzae]
MTVVIVIDERADQDQLDRVIDLAASAGSDLRVHNRAVLSASGDRDAVAAALAAEPAVLSVTRIPAPHVLASSEAKLGALSTVALGECHIGPAGFTVIAGPCSVESGEQLLEIAAAVRDAGCHALRGGAFKPRSSPYAFQGLGREGLELLAEARAMTGLPVVTEILDVRDIEDVADSADMLQVGARNMQNFTLLRELGRLRRPVLLKRGLSATVEETLLAAEYVLEGGNEQLVLCERGIRTFENSYRFTLDVGAVAVLKERTHLPVIVDPSHAAGTTSLVIPLALAAAAAGADGVIVESHHDPATAMCDGKQALPVTRLPELMSRLSLATGAAGRTMHPSVAGRRKVRMLRGEPVGAFPVAAARFVEN